MKASALLGLLALTLLAGALRFTALDALLPHAPEPDAYLVDQVRSMRAGEDARGELHWGKYPHLLSRLATWISGGAPAVAADEQLDSALAAAAADHLLVRRLVDKAV